MKKLLIFGGTSDARLLIDYLIDKDIFITICVATDYGKEFYNDINMNKLDILVGRKDIDEIKELIINHDIILDATHPFALVISSNIKDACIGLNKVVYRLKRASIEDNQALYFNSIESICKYLKDKEGNILATTGSKILQPYTLIQDYQKRVYVRVLPMIESIQLCLNAKIKNSNIIAMQGPFTQELNEAIYKQYHIKYMVTKDSGAQGGLESKIISANNCNVQVLIVEQPIYNGYFIEELKAIIDKQINETKE